jgi:glyoxylase-like metal-dependent hydrolase (beta-lactamase superfamily II)
MTDPALADLDPPNDPRDGAGILPPGQLPTVSRLDERVVRVLAPNAGPMTLDGTNTYVLAAPGSGDAIVVDPGPDDSAHLRAVEDVLRDVDAACSMVLLTHRHVDHAAAALPWAKVLGCPVAAPTADLASEGELVGPGWHGHRGGLEIRAVPTPGHSSDHMCYRLDHGPVLTGDHILGRGTSVVAAPDGDLGAYLASLRRVLDLGPDALYPGHGPDLHEDPTAVIRFYIAHREHRQRQILRLLAEGPQHTTRLVRRIYADVDERLLPAAAASTRAALEHLRAEGRVEVDAGGTATLRDQ